MMVESILREGPRLSLDIRCGTEAEACALYDRLLREVDSDRPIFTGRITNG